MWTLLLGIHCSCVTCLCVPVLLLTGVAAWFCPEDFWSCHLRFGPLHTAVWAVASVPWQGSALATVSINLISFFFLCTGNSKAAEAAGSAYFNPNNPHSVYMPAVSFLACLLSVAACACQPSFLKTPLNSFFIFHCRSGLHRMRRTRTPPTRRRSETQTSHLCCTPLASHVSQIRFQRRVTLMENCLVDSKVKAIGSKMSVLR